MKLKFCFLFLILCQFSFGQSISLSVDGYYQGMNLYVSNPYQSDGFGFCISKVLVNGNVLPATIQNEHFEIDLSLFSLKKGQEVFIELEHYEGCSPRFINPEVLLPNSTFNLVNLSATSTGKVSWSTKNESGRLPFIVEQYKWGRWVDAGEVAGLGINEINNYSLEIIPHSGVNKVRISQTDNSGKKRASRSEDFTSKIKKVIKTPAKVQTSIFFKSDGKAFKTKYEMYDAFGNLLKKGYDNEVDCSNLLNGIYFINFDNKSEKFIKY